MPSGLAGLIIVLGVGLVERVAGLGVGLMVPGLFRAFSKSSLCATWLVEHPSQRELGAPSA